MTPSWHCDLEILHFFDRFWYTEIKSMYHKTDLNRLKTKYLDSNRVQSFFFGIRLNARWNMDRGLVERMVNIGILMFK